MLTWLFEWGDSGNDAGKLQDLSREFLNFLISENVEINKVKVERQWNKVDIDIKVNDEYFIIIEDKVNLRNMETSLKEIKKEAEQYVKNKTLNIKAYIYLS